MQISRRTKRWIMGIVGTVLASIVSFLIINLINTGKFTSRDSSESAGSQKKSALTQEFDGNVGNWKAKFSLALDYKNNQVYGTYYYPKRPSVVYELRGEIIGNKMELTEYTDNEITATCKLVQTGKGCFSGTMYNNDKRSFPMSFCKTD